MGGGAPAHRRRGLSFAVTFRPQALAEARAARQWYDDQRAGLGQDFEREVARVVELLAQTPLLFPIAHGATRRATVRRFPYGLFFQVLGTEVVVLACYHLRRRPRRWGRVSR